MDEQQRRRRLRLGVLSELVARAAPYKLGRTAIMKLAYLLQTAKGVPLGYSFRLYTYGPFDSEVLADLDQAEAIRAVKSEMVTFASGYGYEFMPADKHSVLQRVAASELSKYQDALRWVIERFSQKSAADLELISTILFADREVGMPGQLSFGELVQRVKKIKSRFSDSVILNHVRELAQLGLLVATDQTANDRLQE